MDKDSLKPLIETIIFAADHPISFEKLMNVLEGEKRDEARLALNELINEYAASSRGIIIEEVAGGYQIRTRPEFAPWLRRLFKIGFQKLSKASMETLAMIAYKQPITRMEIEELRGVDSGGVLKTLMDRNLIKIIGRKELPGRPVVYGTTKEFLEVFDLKDLACLPTLKEIITAQEEEIAGETTEDNSAGGDSVQAQGRGDDTGGAGHGQPSGGDGTGDKG
ncbi:MAG: SMC-Scp complex subunit ScpB [Deltaproteobacteria bacterium]